MFEAMNEFGVDMLKAVQTLVEEGSEARGAEALVTVSLIVAPDRLL